MFENRADAGDTLGDHIEALDIEPDRVLAVPDGGVPVGKAVADRLDVPIDPVVAENVPAPGSTDLAAGAVTPDGVCWRNDRLIERRDLRESYVERELERAQQRARDRSQQYDASLPDDLSGETALLVDEGIETGSTAIACLRSIKRTGAANTCLGVPVAPQPSLDQLSAELECDHAFALETPSSVATIENYYESFESLDPGTVTDLLE